MMGENHNKIICSVSLRLSEQIQQGGDLFIERRQIPLHYQMQRRGAASAMAQRQRFQHALFQVCADSFLRQPTESHLIQHRIDSGINGRKGPGIARG